MVQPVSEEQLRNWGDMLCDEKVPLVSRFRALFGLRHASEDLSVDLINEAFKDSSALLKHEAAYCLGQKGNLKALPYLNKILEDENEEVIVRHEAAEAIGAIGDATSIEVLEKYKNSSIQEISETCQLALQRIELLKTDEIQNNSDYQSVDPAPPFPHGDICKMKDILLNESETLFDRYRAMFTLRNICSSEASEDLKASAVRAICNGLSCSKSALFRHEIAFVLGQISHPVSAEYLIDALKNESEDPMVRHECAEALGSIATPVCNDILNAYLKDNERVVKESCVVALDISDYTNSANLQYAMIP